MDKKTLKECKTKLDSLKLEADNSLKTINETEKSLEENRNIGDDMDQSTNLSEIIRLKNIKRQLELKIVQIEAANKRIDQGKFGVCLSCEDDIPKNRLIANPLSIRCLACQEEQELFDKENKLKNKYASQGSDTLPEED